MKASMYFNYTSRSLWRGGQRTILALFCVAVGVMAIVALQSVGQMVNNAFTSNVRDANGGDLAVSTSSVPFLQSDLAFFDTLKSNGTISGYTPIIGISGSTSAAASIRQSFQVEIVDPATFPVVTPPKFNDPSNGSVSSLLANNQVIVDQAFVKQYTKKVGDSFTLHMTTSNQAAITLPVKIAGIVANNGIFSQTSDIVLLSVHDYQSIAPAGSLIYNAIDVSTVDQAHTDRAATAIENQFPLVNIQTAADALKSAQSQVDLLKKFLEIAGLLALLIGGVGIVNTMQVLLSRRRVEIAMLKTVGYRRFDLYLLFGLEAGLLGLVGGVIGAAAAIGVSYGVLAAIQQFYPLTIPFLLDPRIIGGGVLIGLCTALIFGLMPIVQAANIRPLSVIREQPGSNRAASFLLIAGLLLLLSFLFCLMAIFILNDVVLGISAVYGTFIFLGILSLVFTVVVLVIGVLPVPERFNGGYIALVGSATILSALLWLVLPAFGILLLIVSLMGFVVVLLPRAWKISVKMAFRNIGRQRGRTTITLLALYVGVFTIGLLLVLGQNLRDQLDSAIANTLTFNVTVVTGPSDTAKLNAKLSTIPGLTPAHTQERTQTAVVPESVDGTPLLNLLPKGNAPPSFSSLGRDITVLYLSSLNGYDLAHNQVPDTKTLSITDGRNLNASDAGTNNVLLSWSVFHVAPLKGHLKIGSTITVASQDRKTTRTLTVVGVYQSTSGGAAMFSSLDTVTALAPGGAPTTIFYMKIDTDKVAKALDVIGQVTPNASVFNLADLSSYIDQQLNNVLEVLILIASLSLLAGVIIIANAVALAMLERRRELGILKSVGYTSRSILGEVLIENGIVGATGALLAMLLVTLVTSLLGQFVFKSSFGVSWYIAIGLVVGIALLAMIIAALVAWGAVRVRPLEVLRYE
jgi:putative ABC transport system permease protein